MKKNDSLKPLYSKPLLRVSSLIIFLWAFGAYSTQPSSNKQSIVLEGPSEQPVALYVQALLEKAYANLGYQVEYQPIPLARSFVEANEGRIDGLRARVAGATDAYRNLIPVPYPLFDFDVVLIGDRRKCGACSIANIRELSTLRGFKAFSDYLQDKDLNIAIREYTGAKQLTELLEAGRTSAIVLPNVVIPADFYRSNPHWIKYSLVSLPDYHYLHKKHAQLAQKLVLQFLQFEQDGTLEKLKSRYAVSHLVHARQSAELGLVKATSDSWHGYTDTEKSIYRRLLSYIFTQAGAEFEVKIGNWQKAKKTFSQGKYDLLIGAYDFEVGEHRLRSDLHLDYELPMLAFAHDRQKLASWLNGKQVFSVCYRKGFAMQAYLPKGTAVYESDSPNDCLRLFEAKRIDVMIEYPADVPDKVSKKYAKQEVFPGQPLFVAFHDNARGNMLKQVFDNGFRHLIETDRLREFYTDPKDHQAAKLVISSDQR